MKKIPTLLLVMFIYTRHKPCKRNSPVFQSPVMTFTGKKHDFFPTGTWKTFFWLFQTVLYFIPNSWVNDEQFDMHSGEKRPSSGIPSKFVRLLERCFHMSFANPQDIQS